MHFSLKNKIKNKKKAADTNEVKAAVIFYPVVIFATLTTRSSP